MPVRKRRVKRVTQAERLADRRKTEADWKKSHDSTDDRKRSTLVYKWQANALHFGNVCDWTMLECERFIAYVWHSYFGPRATLPVVKPGRGAVSARANRWEVVLPVWARNRNIILHELAHAILDATVEGRDDKFAHGPRFMRLMIELLVAFSTHDRDTIVKSAREWGIPVARRDRVPWRRSCSPTIAECRTRHYHSMSEDLADWMRKGTPRLVHVKGRIYREHR